MNHRGSSQEIRLLVAAAALLLVACGSAGGQSPRSGIEGRVLIGPTCPVVRADSPCPDHPGGSLSIEILDSSNAMIARAQTDTDGRFRVSLVPGRYTLRTTDAGFPRLAPVEVDVPADVYASILLHADSGIR